MPADPEELRAKAMRGNFDRLEEELEEEDAELDLDFTGPGIANSEMSVAAESSRAKLGVKKLTAELLAAMTRPSGARDYASGDDEEGSPARGGQAVVFEDEDESLGSLDAPLWNVVAAAPAPPPRPDGFPPPSKWVTTASPALSDPPSPS